MVTNMNNQTLFLKLSIKKYQCKLIIIFSIYLFIGYLLDIQKKIVSNLLEEQIFYALKIKKIISPHLLSVVTVQVNTDIWETSVHKTNLNSPDNLRPIGIWTTSGLKPFVILVERFTDVCKTLYTTAISYNKTRISKV